MKYYTIIFKNGFRLCGTAVDAFGDAFDIKDSVMQGFGAAVSSWQLCEKADSIYSAVYHKGSKRELVNVVVADSHFRLQMLEGEVSAAE